MHVIIRLRKKNNGHRLVWLAYRSFNSMTGREGSGGGGRDKERNINLVYTGTAIGKQTHKTATHSITNLSRKNQTDKVCLSEEKGVTIKPKIRQNKT